MYNNVIFRQSIVMNALHSSSNYYKSLLWFDIGPKLKKNLIVMLSWPVMASLIVANIYGIVLF